MIQLISPVFDFLYFDFLYFDAQCSPNFQILEYSSIPGRMVVSLWPSLYWVRIVSRGIFRINYHINSLSVCSCKAIDFINTNWNLSTLCCQPVSVHLALTCMHMVIDYANSQQRNIIGKVTQPVLLVNLRMLECFNLTNEV